MLDRRLVANIKISNMKLVAQGFMLFSGLFILTALGLLAFSLNRSITWKHSEGTITKIVSVETKNGTSIKHPVVSFQSVDGSQYVFQNAEYNFLDSYSLGDRVDVVYQTNEPNKASIDNILKTSIVLVSFALVSCCFFGIGFFINRRQFSELEKQQMDPLGRIKFK